MSITLRQLESVLENRFGGVLAAGKHNENGPPCGHELYSVCMGIPWTDSPIATDAWDMRALNDIPVSDDVRTKHLLPVLAAYAGSRSWTEKKQSEVSRRLGILTVNRIIAELPGISEDAARRCREAQSPTEAFEAAAEAGEATHAAKAPYAAEAAFAAFTAAFAYAAFTAAEAADVAKASREAVFIMACQLWLDAAKEE